MTQHENKLVFEHLSVWHEGLALMCTRFKLFISIEMRTTHNSIRKLKASQPTLNLYKPKIAPKWTIMKDRKTTRIHFWRNDTGSIKCFCIPGGTETPSVSIIIFKPQGINMRCIINTLYTLRFKGTEIFFYERTTINNICAMTAPCD